MLTYLEAWKHFVKVFTHLVSWAWKAFPYHQAWQEWLYGIVSFFELLIQIAFLKCSCWISED